ncbi:PhzF family phenazine biosynthesis protein [Mesorhizobium silamurunense]|uniref:PhzF family phenazine biosynthesis protein n=1 Tax=Mesorhizobium silamurunense TaxID=499528 RepID=UPI0035E3FF9D
MGPCVGLPPRREVDFCGHATLATPHILFTKAEAYASLVFTTRVGGLPATAAATRATPLSALKRPCG